MLKQSIFTFALKWKTFLSKISQQKKIASENVCSRKKLHQLHVKNVMLQYAIFKIITYAFLFAHNLKVNLSIILAELSQIINEKALSKSSARPSI